MLFVPKSPRAPRRLEASQQTHPPYMEGDNKPGSTVRAQCANGQRLLKSRQENRSHRFVPDPQLDSWEITSCVACATLVPLGSNRFPSMHMAALSRSGEAN